ncbi:hypothetical protein [Veillonella ratti]|uniref:hypothetical protein n=1 Tax=Veillonella ratti TaxID=103892 RepID=UPI000F8C53FB|nr:hypothetical protein [Veillonella ratti]
MERESLTKSLIAAAVIIICVLAGYFYFYTPKTADNADVGTTTSVTNTNNSNGSLNSSNENKNNNSSTSFNTSTQNTASSSSTNNLPSNNSNSNSVTNVTPNNMSSNNDNARDISSIDQSWKGTKTTVSAIVIKKYDSEKNGKINKFMTIADPNKRSVTMKAVLFDTGSNPDSATKLDEAYTNGTPIILNGKIDVYKGELEIIVKSVGK